MQYSLTNSLVHLKRVIALAQRGNVKRQEYDFSDVRRRFYINFWQQSASKIGADVHSLGDDYLLIEKNGRSTIVQFHLVNIDTYMNLQIALQKPLVMRILSEVGVRVPQSLEYNLMSLETAWRFLLEGQKPCVVKPSSGSGGVGVTTGITTRDELSRASIAASAVRLKSPKLLIETEMAGDSYRLLFLDGELIDAIERRRPTVEVDGKKSIRQLIEQENLSRFKGSPIRALNQISVDLDCKLRLAKSDLSLASVPSKNHGRLIVKNASNENSSFDNSSVLSNVHASYRILGKALNNRLGWNLMGVDVMTSDISVSLDESAGVINEVNIPPGLHYHLLVDNESDRVDIGALILDHIFNNSFLSNSSEGIVVSETDRRSISQSA